MIYQAIEEIEAALKGMLKPEFEESTLGTPRSARSSARSKVGNIAGCMVTGGVIRRNAKVRVLRDGAVVADNLDLASLRREKDDASEVREGFECGLVLRNYQDIKIGDIVEAFEMREIPRADPRSPTWLVRHPSTGDPPSWSTESERVSNPRVRKIADRIQVIVAEMLERRIKDPRLGFVTVTDVRVSGDTQHASVFYTVFGDEERVAGSAAALESAKGLIRSEVGKQLGMRHVPTLEFIHDALPENARHLEELLARGPQADDAEVAGAARRAVRRRGRPVPQAARGGRLDDDASDAGRRRARTTRDRPVDGLARRRQARRA